MIFKYLCQECNIYMVNHKLSIRKYNQTKYFFMEIINIHLNKVLQYFV